MLQRVLLAEWRRLSGSQRTQVPSWHDPDTFSLWMYPNGPTEKSSEHGPLILLFHEWLAGDVWGLTFTGHYWLHSDEVKSSREPDKLEGELLGVFEDHQAVALLIARGKLKRLGELPAQMLREQPRTSARLGVWG